MWGRSRRDEMAFWVTGSDGDETRHGPGTTANRLTTTGSDGEEEGHGGAERGSYDRQR